MTRSEVIVLGVDPGLASFGWGAVRLFPKLERIVRVEVIKTKPSPKKLKVLAADDTSRRARELATTLREVITRFKPVVIAAEAYSAPRHASSAGKLNRAWGVLDGLTVEFSLPLVQTSPQAIKKLLCEDASASKAQVQAALELRYDRQFQSFVERSPKGDLEHGFDAVGAVVACLDSDVILMARGML
jgi:crossover junction endodeoxyribonuclease RuvC